MVQKDPSAIITLTGDHDAASFLDTIMTKLDLINRDGLPADLLAQDRHEVLLAIRWGADLEPEPYPFRSLANVMRFVLYRLSGDKALRDTAVADDANVLDEGFLYQTIENGRPLPEWRRRDDLRIRRSAGH